MKLNEEELSIIPATPRYAKDHMEIYKYANGFLDDFLAMDEDTNKLSFRSHNDVEGLLDVVFVLFRHFYF